MFNREFRKYKKAYKKYVKKYVKGEYIKSYIADDGTVHNGGVVKCFYCQSENIKVVNLYLSNSYVCESCGELLGNSVDDNYSYYFPNIPNYTFDYYNYKMKKEYNKE